MRLKTWLVAALGLGILVALTAISMMTLSRNAEGIYAQLDALNSRHRRIDENLWQLRSDVSRAAVFVRDFLLNVPREGATDYQAQIAAYRQANMVALDELRTLVDNEREIDNLEARLTEYWETYDRLSYWTPPEKLLRSATFLQREMVPRREAALALAREIEELANSNADVQRMQVALQHEALREDMRRLVWWTVLLGLGVAVIVVLRLRILERRSGEAEHQMRELSQQLVNAQEEERRHLSRELHDHVAQVLTGLRMELGRIERMNPGIGTVVAECKKLVDDMFRTVRDLALGLRPSMLDDFGLKAALEWHVRDFMARYDMGVDLSIDGDFEELPDQYRTCIYRVVQEAMTNCARHAEASKIAIEVAAVQGELTVTVTDDGIGLSPSPRRRGLGLRGIDERVKDLNGTMSIAAGSDGGTALVVRLPLPVPSVGVELARAAS
jgi:signal transduction histidine kinase